MPLAWLLGSWEGVGVLGYPTVDGGDRQFGQEVTVEHDGRDFLRWNSRTWALDDDGSPGAPQDTESGFWRVLGPGGAVTGAADGRPATPVPAGFDVELLLSHPTGVVEMYAGTAAGPRIDLATDVVMRSPSARVYTAGRRLYGMVEGDLLWAMDMAADGHEMAPYASARLRRTT